MEYENPWSIIIFKIIIIFKTSKSVRYTHLSSFFTLLFFQQSSQYFCVPQHIELCVCVQNQDTHTHTELVSCMCMSVRHGRTPPFLLRINSEILFSQFLACMAFDFQSFECVQFIVFQEYSISEIVQDLPRFSLFIHKMLFRKTCWSGKNMCWV